MNTNAFKNLVENCLYNWLGYGNIDSPVWFMGMEEGGAEIWRQKTKTLTESLSIRADFSIAMDFQHVWEELYNIPLESFKGANVWRYMAAFLLSLEGIEPSSINIHSYVYDRKHLGKLGGNHFLCEFLPLPRKTNNSIDEYKGLWKTNGEYITEVSPKRFDLIKDMLLECSNVKLLVCYDKRFYEMVTQNFHSTNISTWQDSNNKPYNLIKLDISEGRDVYLLKTPFFGQGQASYRGLQTAAKIIKDKKIV